MAAPPPEEWPSLSKINPELEVLIPSLGGFKLVTPTTTLEGMRTMVGSQPPSKTWPDVAEKNIKITMRDGFVNRARVYSHSSSSTGEENENGKPLLVMMFGGAWVTGKLEFEETNCRSWVRRQGGVAVSIEHRLSPEHPFPGPVEDAYDAVKWIAENSKSLGADPSKAFILGGASSGSCTMDIIAHLWRDEGKSPPITGLYFAVPISCIVSAIPEKYKSLVTSWEQNKDAPIFDQEISLFSYRIVKPDPFSPLRSPMLFPTGHKGLPPTYFQVAGGDPWRDVGLLYEKIMREEDGVKTKIDVFPGLPHGFWSIFPKSEFAKEHRVKTDEGFDWLVEMSNRK